jgi:hypothetical protein
MGDDGRPAPTPFEEDEGQRLRSQREVSCTEVLGGFRIADLQRGRRVLSGRSIGSYVNSHLRSRLTRGRCKPAVSPLSDHHQSTRLYDQELSRVVKGHREHGESV